MMQVNKQAKVMSNGDVMGRGPTNEVSRQTAFSHTKDTTASDSRRTQMWNALLVWSVQEVFNTNRLTELMLGRETTERIAEKVAFLESCRMNLILVRIGRVFDVK
jgi:hypothetical protein